MPELKLSVTATTGYKIFMTNFFCFHSLKLKTKMKDPTRAHMNKVKLIFLKKSENYREIVPPKLLVINSNI